LQATEVLRPPRPRSPLPGAAIAPGYESFTPPGLVSSLARHAGLKVAFRATPWPSPRRSRHHWVCRCPRSGSGTRGWPATSRGRSALSPDHSRRLLSADPRTHHHVPISV